MPKGNLAAVNGDVKRDYGIWWWKVWKAKWKAVRTKEAPNF
jgi:hypothetical protein